MWIQIVDNNYETSFTKDSWKLSILNIPKLVWTKTKGKKIKRIKEGNLKRAYFQIIRNNVSIIASYHIIVSFVYQADDFLVKSSSAIVERIEKKREEEKGRGAVSRFEELEEIHEEKMDGVRVVGRAFCWRRWQSLRSSNRASSCTSCSFGFCTPFRSHTVWNATEFSTSLSPLFHALYIFFFFIFLLLYVYIYISLYVFFLSWSFFFEPLFSSSFDMCPFIMDRCIASRYLAGRMRSSLTLGEIEV